MGSSDQVGISTGGAAGGAGMAAGADPGGLVPPDVFGGARRARGYGEGSAEQRAEQRAEQLPVPPPAFAGAGAAVAVAPPAQVEVEGAAVEAQPMTRAALAAPRRPRPARWGWRGRMNRVGLKLSPAQAELEHRDAVSTIRRATWTRAVNAIVTNPKGGVGKSPTAVILAGVLGQVRGGYVCAWEAAESPGSLARRAEGEPRRGLAELLAQVDQVNSAGSLGGYTAPQTSHADVIGSIGRREVLRASDVLAVRRVLDTYYRITVTDTGNNPGHEAYAAALRTADAVVVPCLVSLDALDGVHEALDVIASTTATSGPGSVRDHGGEGLLSRVVVVLTHDGGPEDSDVDAAVRERLAQLPVEVVEVPYDPAIRLGGEIALGTLSEQSTRAWTAAGAALVRALERAPIETDLVGQLQAASSESSTSTSTETD